MQMILALVMAIAHPQAADARPFVQPVAWHTHGAARPARQRYQVDNWLIDTVSDPFSNTIRCNIHAKNMRYVPGAVLFQLPRSVNTFNAKYRIDAGPVVSWRVHAMDLTSSGVAIQNSNLTNPSGGQVAIPIAVLALASAVAIQPAFNGKVYTFDLHALSAALSGAANAGCGPPPKQGGAARPTLESS
jgi:hypothetical protein